MTYFDLYDTCADYLSEIVYSEKPPESTRLISFAKNMEAFDNLENGLFNNLFTETIISNRNLSSYGLKKINQLAFGLAEVLNKNKTVSELYEEIAAIGEEEVMYNMLTDKVRHITKGASASYSTPEQREALNKAVGNYIMIGENAKRRIPEKLLNRVIQDYNLEIIYFTETIPNMILKDDWTMRKEFIHNSGLDIFRIEQLERIYCSRNGLQEDYIDNIAASKN